MSDLLVIGPGRLGMLVAQNWQKSAENCKIFLKFRSANDERKERLTKEGFTVLSEEEETPEVDFIVFCAPPTGNETYAQDVELGFKHLKSGGLYVFTSSGGVFAENSGQIVNEESALNRTERNGKIIDAEKIVLEKGGCVLRLGGLYSLDIGAHSFYARGGEIDSKPDGLINFVHYEDAASAVVLCLSSPSKVGGELMVLADGVPISRQQIWEAVKSSNFYSGGPDVKFVGGPGTDGKIYDCAKVRGLINWTPKYTSLQKFLETN